MMRVTLITDNDVVLWKVCYNSQSQDVLNFHAKIETSCYAAQYKMWNEVMLWLIQMMGYNANIPLPIIRPLNDAEENLYPSIFDVPYSTVIFCKLQHA